MRVMYLANVVIVQKLLVELLCKPQGVFPGCVPLAHVPKLGISLERTNKKHGKIIGIHPQKTPERLKSFSFLDHTYLIS